MFNSIVSLVANALNAAKEFFGFQTKKLDLKNQADVKAAAVAQQEINAVDRAEAAVASADLKEVRHELAE
jgi:hypothetical protein